MMGQFTETAEFAVGVSETRLVGGGRVWGAAYVGNDEQASGACARPHVTLTGRPSALGLDSSSEHGLVVAWAGPKPFLSEMPQFSQQQAICVPNSGD